MASPNAFVTLVSSDAYLPGALAQVAALADLHDTRDFTTLCLVTPESVDVATIKTLRRAFDVVVGVEILEDADERGLQLLGRPDLTTVLTKLHVFRLTQFSKIIFLDADVLPLRPLSHLFDITHEFSAVPDVGWPDIFNSGVLVLSPGEDKFNEINQLLKSKGSWDGGDQGILNEWRGGDWNRLSFTYNTTPTAAYTYAPAYERYGSQISALHFIGKNKPWNSMSYRAPFSSKASSSKDSPQQAYDYDSLVDRWYAVYDKHYRSNPATQTPSFQFERYSSVWDEGTTSNVTAGQSGPLGLDELRQLAIDGVAGTPKTEKRAPGEGIYYSLPLEGRIDLMRPRKPDPEKSADDSDTVEEGPSRQDNRHRPPAFDFELEEMLPSTPQFRSTALYGEDEAGIYRWHTLPTPHPHELPPSPQLQLVSLPPTPTPHRFEPVKSDFYASESESEAIHLGDQTWAPSQESLRHREPNSRATSRPSSRRASHSFHHRPQLDQPPNHSPNTPGHRDGQIRRAPTHLHERSLSEVHTKRPMSPPLLAWNPALEPPPNTQPSVTAFPADTYFPNIWDHQHSHERAPSSSINFFQPPPPPEIPSSLIKEGHYRNVTGNDSMSPSPDRGKVKTIFPWEDRPRKLPNRVFPDSDAPPPALFISLESPSQTSTAAPSTPEQPKATPLARIHPLSPLIGLPPTLTYSNAWDTVPSIQKYASKLVRPAHAPPPPLAPAFDDDRWRKARPKWDDRLSASSRDGDDEDNADDEEEDDDVNGDDTKWDSETEHKEVRRRDSRSRSRSSPKGKEYRDQAVQTDSVLLRTQGTQTEKLARRPSTNKRHSIAPITPITPNFLVSPTTRDAAASTTTDRPRSAAPTAQRPSLSGRPSKVSLKSASASPIHSPRARSPVRSPVREFIVPANPPAHGSNHRLSVSTVPIAPIRPPLKHQPAHNGHNGHWSPRQTSNDSSVTSPASSSASGFPDYHQPPAEQRERPVRVGGRVFDPARGVEIFKRGSEEVLARFLRMGSWENEAIR